MSAAARPAPVSSQAPRFLVAAGNFFFHTRNALFPLVFVGIALASPPRPFLGSPKHDRWMDLAGLLVGLLGQGLRVLVIGLAYIRRGGKDGRIYADDLVVEGLFAHSRNPLYVGNVLMYFGLLLVLNSPAGWLVGAPFCLFAYGTITLAEEEFLARKFGPVYEEYCRLVNRYVPSLRGLGETVRGMRFEWRRVIRKEYGTTFTWITTFLALQIWERVSWYGAAGSAHVVRVAGIAWAVTLGAYVVARVLKKTRRLESS